MTLQPISTAPRDGAYILLFGPSGYVTTTPLRCEICKFDASYAKKTEAHGWLNHYNGRFLYNGGAPTHWLPLPEMP